MCRKILIMGAGHQGLAMAAHLSKNGVETYLWNRTIEHIKSIISTRKIFCSGILEGEISIKKVSANLEDVLQKEIMVTTPSSAHKDIARLLAPMVDETYTIILNPGRTFGILEFVQTLRECGCKSIPLVAETQTIIYTCRRDPSNGVRLYALKNGVPIAAFSKEETSRVIDGLPECIRDRFIPANSFFQTSLGNVGMILHCVPVLMNVGWIENKKTRFDYYYDGITESIAKVLEKLDLERRRVAQAVGEPVESLSEWLVRVYDAQGENLYQQLQNNVYYRGIDAPQSVHHRYLEEDIPNGLVALESLGNVIGIQTPVTSCVIDFANIVMDVDYREDGRNYELLKNVWEK